MSRMLILQLERFGRLSSEEKLALSGASMRPRRLARDMDFPREDERPDTMTVLLAGFACRYAVLPKRRRQIVAYLLPGDFCDQSAGGGQTDHCIGALSAVNLASFAREDMAQLARRFPRIGRALELANAAEQATMRQWLLSLGHRNALEGTAHLLCELFTRLHCLGLTQEDGCELPLRQTDLADALAISAVHLNRTLTELRRRKLVTFIRHQLCIDDWPALKAICGFQPDYLFAADRDDVGDASHSRAGELMRALSSP
jgi:CRP-like cAMP-binding protein